MSDGIGLNWTGAPAAVEPLAIRAITRHNPTLRYQRSRLLVTYGACGFVTIWTRAFGRGDASVISPSTLSIRAGEHHFYRLARRERAAALWWGRWAFLWREIGRRHYQARRGRRGRLAAARA